MPTMSKITLFVTLGLMAFGASGGRVAQFMRTSFPSDLAQREALHRCSIVDSKFSRFYESDRIACYQQNHVAAVDPARS
jgi:hypothetical protein